METFLVNCVQKNLNRMMQRNAIFFCERLCAEFPSEVNVQLLARCYLNSNQPHCAYHILKDKRTDQSRYLFALSCFEMDLCNEAEAALMPTEECSAEVPNGAAFHYLLGLIYRNNGRRKSSVEQFRKALSIDPLFWAAYEELCILGEAEEAAAVFSEEAIHCVQKLFNKDQRLHSGQTLGSEDASSSHLKHVEGNKLCVLSENHLGEPLMARFSGQVINDCASNLSLYNNPSPVPTQLLDIVATPTDGNMQVTGVESSFKSNSWAPQRRQSVKVPRTLFPDSAPRRSARLAARKNLNTSKQAGSDANQFHVSSSKSKHGTPTVCNSQPENINEENWPETSDDASSQYRVTFSSVPSPADGKYGQCKKMSKKLSTFITKSSTIASGIIDMIGLLRLLGEGYRLLCMYRCQDALNVFQKLSLKQYHTNWVLSQVGKAYFHLMDYLNADCAFSLAHQISPYSLEGMDMYSTVFYQMKEDTKLCFLANELISINRLAPQSWCAVGNCYSSQKDHETALKSFQRAVQLNSRFAYAHTLCGHEYVALEDYENGVICYQRALHADARHYNSWYGLGMIYLRQEKFEFSEHHFRQAFHINPRSSVIMCYMGITLQELKRTEEALEVIEKAILADKKNPLPIYYKANILLRLGNSDEALEALKELEEHVPFESSIHALMGEIYRGRKLYGEAMLHFGIALDLKPPAKDVAKIKAAVEKLVVPDDLEKYSYDF